LKISSCSVIASSNVEVSASKYVNGDSGKTKDTSKDGIGLERKDKVGEESKAPDDKIESNGIVVVRACGTFGSIASGRVRSSNAERGKLDHAERKPEDTEERERVHLWRCKYVADIKYIYASTYGKEVTHDPFENGSETEKNRTSKEEDTDNASKTASTSKAHQDHREGKSRDDETSKAHGHGVGEASDIVAMAGSFGCEV
jgi:hypothetical protein